MAATDEDFAEILDAEGEAFVDLDKLRKIARHGIPDSVQSHCIY